MNHSQLCRIARKQGIQAVERLIDNPMQMLGEDPIDVLRWRKKAIPGAVIFLRVDKDEVPTDEPQVCAINAKMEKYYKYEHLHGEPGTPYLTILLAPGGEVEARYDDPRAWE